MSGERASMMLWVGVAASLAWAAVEARQLDWRSLGKPAVVAPAMDPGQVESSFAPIRDDIDADRTDQAVLALRRRTEHGPHRGTAWFLLGEVAADQEAHTEAVRHYRRAVEQDPAVADRHAPFRSGAVIEARLTALLEGPWLTDRPPEVRDLYYLRRRLGGGCE